MPETIRTHYLLAVENLKPRMVSNRPEWYNHVVNLPTQQQAVYTTLLLDYQVKTEGFVGYLTSSFGMFATQALTNLEKIGSVKHFHILQNVLDSVNKEPIEDLSQYDQQYQAIEDENLNELLVSFLDENA
ncbi:uncharacterized protein DUF4375 [Arcicella aurantiaca]|uniref:Uncharacterized protein DUF4375 n=1 Tax=Arcicella aurantiaca TaxID=591202 RepID=A0A316DI52_9BACT|nr:DUF4375 domain-containing protein [Arcicella aurantiaca]PWK17182.1 uncharacterized protein DUF4375 [Arcicella aurantiaca]